MAGLLETLSDGELAVRARAGSADCFEEIVRRYQVPLVRFLSRRFPSRRDVEDILQDTFVKAWRQLGRYDSRYAFRTWIYTIAYRLAVSRGRSDTATTGMLPDHVASRTVTPEAAALGEEQRRNIWDVAKRVLTEEQYLTLWLYYVDEVPAGDVAKILKRSWVSVKTMMHRARKKLAPHLAGEAFARASEPSKEQSSPHLDLRAVAAAPSLVKAGEL
jgi:RNA polymerase sigma-70 factor, ECF subfamily